MADLDHVTKLASRGAFEAWLDDRPTLAGAAFVLVDVVGLKQVNEERGFLAGDEALRLVAERLLHVASEAMLVARLGGDELVAVFDHANQARRAALRLTEPGGQPRLRAGMTIATAGDTRETLIDRLYATARAS